MERPLRPADILTDAEVLDRLGVSRATLDGWIASDLLRPLRRLPDGQSLFLLADLPPKGDGSGAARRRMEAPAEPEKAARVLLVCDQPATARQVSLEMRRQGYELSLAAPASRLARALRASTPDIVLVDLDSRRLKGWETFSSLRAQVKRSAHPHTPLVVLSGEHASPEDMARALRQGAWDFLKKPFSSNVLAARMSRLLARRFWRQLEADASGDEVTSADGWLILDLGLKTLRRVDPWRQVPTAVARLTAKEMQLLRLFLKRPGLLFPRRLLLEVVWGYSSDMRSRTLDCHIRNLREKLGPQRVRIETTYALGYRFVDPLPAP